VTKERGLGLGVSYRFDLRFSLSSCVWWRHPGKSDRPAAGSAGCLYVMRLGLAADCDAVNHRSNDE
jgi:hypothetical protein